MNPIIDRSEALEEAHERWGNKATIDAFVDGAGWAVRTMAAKAQSRPAESEGPDYGPAWLGVASARVMAQPGIAAKHLRDYAALLKAQAQAESVAVPDGRLKALEAAVSALYFDDGSDFRAALGSVIRYLDERLAGDMLCHPKAAYDRVQAMLAAPQPSQAQAPQLPDGWVPLTIEYEPGYPEDIAFGPQRMMDRLKKWLDRYFAILAAQAQTEPVAVPHGWKLVPVDPTPEMCMAAVVYANGNAVYKNVAAEALKIEEAIYGEVWAAMLAVAPQPAHAQAEPTWTPDECARVLETLRYVQGIAERGEGRQMREDETLEAFVLGYVKRLEAAQAQAEPYAWAVSGLGRPFYGEFAEQDARAEARRCGGTSEAFPLYRHSAQPKRQPLTARMACACGDEYDPGTAGGKEIFITGRCPGCNTEAEAAAPQPAQPERKQLTVDLGMNTPTIFERLRALHAARTRHFTSPEGVQAWSIVATEERLADLLAAADELDRIARFATVQYVNIDGAGLELLTHDQVRQAALAELQAVQGYSDFDSRHWAIEGLCKRLGVEL